MSKLEDPERLRSQIYEAARIISDGRAEMGQECSTEDALKQYVYKLVDFKIYYTYMCTRISISPQCGFSSVSSGIHGTVEEVRKADIYSIHKPFALNPSSSPRM